MFVLEQDSQSKQGGYSMHQLQGNKEFGSEKKGYLLKKSDGYTHTHFQVYMRILIEFSLYVLV